MTSASRSRECLRSPRRTFNHQVPINFTLQVDEEDAESGLTYQYSMSGVVRRRRNGVRGCARRRSMNLYSLAEDYALPRWPGTEQKRTHRTALLTSTKTLTTRST